MDEQDPEERPESGAAARKRRINRGIAGPPGLICRGMMNLRQSPDAAAALEQEVVEQAVGASFYCGCRISDA